MTDHKPDPTAGTGGNLGPGQSAGGAYANAAGDQGHAGGQSRPGYHGGQAGSEGAGEDDHHAARRDDDAAETATYRDHPSQHAGPANDRLRAANAGNADLADEAHAPGDRIQGSDGEIVSGKP